MMMALMVAAASSANAQDNLWKKAQSLCDANKLEEAITTITPCLTSDQTLKKADAWNTLFNIDYAIFLRENTIEVNNKKNKTQIPYDTVAYYNGIVGALKAAMECDKYDVTPNEKGKVKIRFREINGNKVFLVRPQVINAGLAAYNKKDYAKAFDNFSLYIESAKAPLFSAIKTDGPDKYLSTVAYYASLVAYSNKNYDGVKKYIDIALADTSVKRDAMELKVYIYKDTKDSVNYLNALKEAHASYPTESKYFDMLVNYYLSAGNPEATKKFASEEMAKDPNNKSALYVNGVVLMNQKMWDEAVVSFKKAIELDPEYMEANFNAGVCLNSKASEMRDKLADKRGNLTMAQYNSIIPIVKESCIYLEKARQIAPDRKDLWAYPLYTVYYALKNTAKTAEMEKLLKIK